ncbi:formiminoglutamase [Roseivirga ehrenbergii]|uniref:Formimidoylglutamase n=1 Tax=Roseivirga ehrenbergii (strain DSM 102268 / JCM 13514 / KCTC 12282 / NCIMB 14502 / KMM 6017) TaxID=279360 RepID=A0A150XTK6_ROSEK|nr:formimidoylglutamase [Roseivirga ehrenbergii]KYG82077.1 formiminoglutamase [Roseivirga ehrenbergii]TCL01900.1 formiminoglutamase [Roseivirga ehrenbergii]
MNALKPADLSLWKGRKDENLGRPNYWYEMVEASSLEKLKPSVNKQLAILGYAVDEGVKRNQGRVGAIDGPDAIRKMLAILPNHFQSPTDILDFGNVVCADEDLDATHGHLSMAVSQLLNQGVFPILLGGGHDIAYAHYTGVRQFLDGQGENQTIGIINLDAHFDLRNNKNGNTSGTPFFQIAHDCKAKNQAFEYCCLGIQRSANTQTLFSTADELGVTYLENTEYTTEHWAEVKNCLNSFLQKVDKVYLTIDLDGFSSAYAPGVSAPSPMGFSPDIVLKTLDVLIESQKLISVDLAELSPKYDQDNSTARLAARLVHYLVSR